jgi:hypothetical protein
MRYDLSQKKMQKKDDFFFKMFGGIKISITFAAQINQ